MGQERSQLPRGADGLIARIALVQTAAPVAMNSFPLESISKPPGLVLHTLHPNYAERERPPGQGASPHCAAGPDLPLLLGLRPDLLRPPPTHLHSAPPPQALAQTPALGLPDLRSVSFSLPRTGSPDIVDLYPGWLDLCGFVSPTVFFFKTYLFLVRGEGGREGEKHASCTCPDPGPRHAP